MKTVAHVSVRRDDNVAQSRTEEANTYELSEVAHLLHTFISVD